MRVLQASYYVLIFIICTYYDIIYCIYYHILFEVVEKGQQLLQLIACSSLERDLANFTEAWVAASSELDSEVKRSVATVCIVYLI